MYDSSWSVAVHLLVFALAAAAVAMLGSRLAAQASRLARRTGLGQALTGALLLGAATSLSGITTSVSAALAGAAELAAGNALGGIAAQTVFLAIADRFHRRANLEHAAASDENMLQGAILIGLLSVPLLTTFTPTYSLFGIHPVSPLILLAYVLSQHLVVVAKGREMWKPRMTEHTQGAETQESRRTQETHRPRPETSDDSVDGSSGGSSHGHGLAALWARFLLTAVGVAVTGYFLAQSGVALAAASGLSETLVGGLFTAVATSFPELVTVIAAVRMGALTMAVSDIMGGNSFDVIFLAVADIAYADGSIYHAMGRRPQVLLVLTILLTSILLMGLIRRQKHGIANIGFESVLLLLVYIGGFVLITLTMS